MLRSALQAKLVSWAAANDVDDFADDYYAPYFLLNIDLYQDPVLTIATLTPQADGTAQVSFNEDISQINGTIKLLYSDDLKTWTLSKGPFVKAVLGF